MKKIRIFLLGLSLGLLLLSSWTRAEDIDIYSDNAATAGPPNVLLILDNAANFEASADACSYSDSTATPSLNGSAGGIEQCAINNVVHSLPVGSVNLGLMVYNNGSIRDINGQNCGGSEGGCLAYPITPLTADTKTQFLAWVKSWRTNSSGSGAYIKASGEATGSVMQEAWAYYAGRTGLSGRTYTSPPAGCQKNFVIFIGNAFTASGSPGDGGSSSPQAALAAAPNVTAEQLKPITIPSGSYGAGTFSCGNYTMPSHTDSSGLFADEWARYMYQGDLYNGFEGSQSITTYTVGLLGPQCKPDYPALMQSMADASKSKYFATSNYNEISTAILSILNEVQAVNSVFSSASLPVSVNAQGTYLNQIFLGMFRPDAGANPRWLGNLKQFQFILEYPDPTNPDPNRATLRLGDSTGKSAISAAGTGFIKPDAVSFWTKKDTSAAPDSTGGFFISNPQGSGTSFDAPDGELVEKGGAAQLARSRNLEVNYVSSPSSPRKLYTYCPAGSSCNASLSDTSNAFATTNSAITDTLLSSSDPISVTSIVRTGTQAVVTAPSHGFLSGEAITISGATQSDYNGQKTITVTSSNTFVFTVPEYPRNPPLGTFTASKPGLTPPLLVASLTRSGATATTTLTAPHGFAVGQPVTITGAAQSRYNGTFVVASVPSSNSFTYAVTEDPVSPAGGGTATVGSTSRDIEFFNTNPNPGVVRATGSTTVSVVTTQNHGFDTGNQVTIANVRDGLGNLVSGYNIGPVTLTKTGNKSFSYTIPATSPASPATGTIYADGSATIKDVTLSRSANTVTAVSATAHGFSNGETLSIGGSAGANEEGYIGSFKIVVVNPTTFTYTVITTPASPATGSITARKIGTSDRVGLINWVRGEDNFGDEASPGFGYTVRPSIHGDVLHSRPVVVNYGDSRGLVVFYGSNDGVFRAVNGSQTAAIGTSPNAVPAGGELWGLVLPEFFGRLNRQRVNTPELKLPSTVLPGAQPKDYFVDGSMGVYQLLCGAGATTGNCVGKPEGSIDKAYIYLTMRRGGRFIYALDVTDPTDPKFMWKIKSSDAGFAELGQTWSRPRVTLVKGYTNPVLVFGAGYDPAEDAEPPAANTMGRGIFVVDAVSGTRVWTGAYTAGASACSGSATQASCGVSGMNWAIAADISFVDRDNDGKTDRFYAADVGGNVWRVDMEPAGGITPDKWQTTKLAALGCATGACAAGTAPRKFFFPPNIVSVGATGATGSYDEVLLGSGDREHPLISTNPVSAYNVVNRFYMIKDTKTGKDANSSPAATVITETSLFNATTTAYAGSGSGFYVTLLFQDANGNPLKGEKVVNASTTVRGTTFFGTNRPATPSPTSCASNLGVATGYALNPFTGKFESTVYDGGGLPPSPTTGIVTIDTPAGPVKKSFCVGCGGGDSSDSKSSLGAGDLDKAVPKNVRRTYWYKQ